MSFEQPATHMGQNPWTSEPCLYSRTSILIRLQRRNLETLHSNLSRKSKALARIEIGNGHQGQQEEFLC